MNVSQEVQKPVQHADDTYQKVLREGAVFEQGQWIKTWNRRWFVLTPQNITTYKTDSDGKKPTGKVRHIFALEKITLEKSSLKTKPNCYKLTDTTNASHPTVYRIYSEDFNVWAEMISFGKNYV